KRRKVKMENQVLQNQKHEVSKVIEFEKNISDSVTNRVNQLSKDGRLNLPANYSVGNAIASAWLIIQGTVDKNGRSALEVCTKESIANSLLDMSVMGLNPAKKQGYFIVYGNKLSWFTSYFGKCAIVKRLKGIENEPIATLIYEGDELILTHTPLREELVLDHKTSWENKMKGKIVGCYATVKQGENIRSAVMTKAEILEAWTKNPSPSNRREHETFEGEFCKRTVINRLVKMITQTSNDDDLLAETMIRNEDQHFDFSETEIVETKKEIEMNANKGEKVGFPKEEQEIQPTASSEDFKTNEQVDDDPGY
ncbi:MAG TPA: recombinase RecT, partial [Salinivirgaceae bacterium]|nr:recombinase RecT [Salinivirgaceae bacterium]